MSNRNEGQGPLQSIQNAHADRDIVQTLVVGGGSRLGSGVWKWTEWLDRVRADAPGALATSTRLVLSGKTIQREIHQEAARAAEEFLSGRVKRRSVVVYGKHGTGRSVLAMGVAEQLNAQGFEHIYVVDDYLRFSQTDLTTILPSGARSLIVVDDAAEQGAFRPLYNSIGSSDICSLLTVPTRRLAATYAALDRRPHQVLDLPGSPTSDEIDDLATIISGPTLSRKNRRMLGRYNVRSVCRILAGEGPPSEIARKLLDLRYEDRETALAISLLSKCGERNIVLPSNLLMRVIGGTLSESISSWIQTRPLYDGHGGNSVWIEDHEVLRLSERLWRDDYMLDSDAYEEEVRDILDSLFKAIHASDASDRLVARQFLRRSPARVATWLAEEFIETVSQCVDQESDRAAVLAWWSALPGSGVADSDRVRAVVTSQLGRLEPDVGTLLEFISDAAGTSRLEVAEISDLTSSVSIDLWARVLEVFEGRRVKALGVGTFHLLLDIIRAHPNALDILAVRNSSQILGNALSRYGLHHHRTWLRDAMLDSDEFRINQAQYLMAVAERCVMQKRHFVALDTRWNPTLADQNDVASLELEYDRLLATKIDDRIDDVIARVSNAIAHTPAKGARDQAWYQLLGFAEYYRPPELGLLARDALDFGLSTWTSQSLAECHVSLAKVLQTNRRTHRVSIETIARLVELAVDKGFASLAPGQFVHPLLEATAACGDNDGRGAAILAMRSFATATSAGDHDAFDQAWSGFVSTICPWKAVGDTVISHHFDRPAMVMLQVRSAVATFSYWGAGDRSEHLKLLVASWGDLTQVRSRLFSACLALGELALAASLVPKDWRDASWWVPDMARLMAAKGDLTSARRFLAECGSLGYVRAHPLNVSLAQYELSKSTLGFERSMWRMLASLTRPGELQPRLDAPCDSGIAEPGDV